ncbi:Imm9 family immunity protein [Pseudomonas putida]|uniref:Imm9 family immunity protein n=1 Tax=Pseudomonas putida TaxID=303 RepID=UPI0021199A11|nr:Imm9 family immunity protein [Pseudomonas putida]
MPNLIKCILSNEVPCINDLIDINDITHKINEYIEKIRPTINIEKLNGWGILISATIRNTDKIGIYKRTTRYRSDNEFEISISVPPPSLDDASYGLPPKELGYFLAVDEKKFRAITPLYSNYKSLGDYITNSIELAIRKTFEIGITCHGVKIQFEEED